MANLKLIRQSLLIGLAAACMVLVLRLALVYKSAETPTIAAPQTRPQTTQPVRTSPSSFADADASAAPAMVNIYTSKYVIRRRDSLLNDPIFQHFFSQALRTPEQRRETSLGSGAIVSPNGYLLTNNHGIFSADEISVMFRNGRSLAAKLSAMDRLAVYWWNAWSATVPATARGYGRVT